MTLHSSTDFLHGMIIPLAFVLDVVVGDPRWLPHPIRWMGKAIEVCDPVFRSLFKNQRLAGLLFASGLIAGCWGIAALVALVAWQCHPVAGVATEIVMIFFSLSARSLTAAAMEVYGCLKEGRVDTARSKLAMIVGRDVARYGPDDIARGAVETVSENFVDGVLSPLFFAAIGGAPLAMAYKMVNTLDSMVGYKTPRFRHFGWAAARIDDIANFIPARLSVAIIALAAACLAPHRGWRALATAFKEGSHHASPNAGYAEAAFAGALAVKLNGPNFYHGIRVEKPYIGKSFNAPTQSHIQSTCELMMLSALYSTALAWGLGLA